MTQPMWLRCKNGGAMVSSGSLREKQRSFSHECKYENCMR
jgi:hypothetical protein